MSQRFVVDTTVVSKLYLRDEEWVANADALFAKFERGEVELVAPRLLKYEVPAAIRNAIVKRRIDERYGEEAVTRFRQLPLPIMDDLDILEEAFKIANRYSRSFYDSIFLILAQDLGWNLVTADDKLWKPLHHQLPYIIHLRYLD